MKSVAICYSEALYSLAEDMGLTDRILAQVEEINKALSQNPDFVKLLDSNALTCGQRLSAADDAFAGAEEILLSFIKILTEKHLAHIFPKCATAYRKEYDKKHGVSHVMAETAVPMSAELSDSLRTKLEKVTGKKIVLENRIKPGVLGGIVLKTEGKEIDASILRNLKNMGNKLSARY